MKTLKDKVVAITGGGSGIGAALAELCGQKGARLALSDVNQNSLDMVAAKLAAMQIDVHTQKVDVAKAKAVEQWATAVTQHYGGVDVLVNNAGIALSQSSTHMERALWEKVFNINFWGVVNGTNAFLPVLQQQPEAHIVNISSLFGLIAVPTQAAYNASKFAVRGYTEALRQDLSGSRVHITCVHPGGVCTNLVKTGQHFDGLDGDATDTTQMADMFEQIASTTPEQAAQQIMRGILKNRRRVLVGWDAKILDVVQRFLPESYDRILLPGLRWNVRRLKQQRAS